jgi:hypothetical protein
MDDVFWQPGLELRVRITEFRPIADLGGRKVSTLPIGVEGGERRLGSINGSRLGGPVSPGVRKLLARVIKPVRWVERLPDGVLSIDVAIEVKSTQTTLSG